MATKTKGKHQAQAPQYREIPPNAAKTLAALREMGYGSFDAVMDLIDNSIDARAKAVSVEIKDVGKKGRESLVISIADDGRGMSEETLAEALRLGSDTKHDEKKDLGKYGMGLVTASISVARRVSVLTREKGKQAYEADFNLDTIARENKFVITLEPATDSAKVIERIGDQGTLVRLENIDRISDTNVGRFAANLRTRLGQVYRHYLDDGLAIAVNGRKVEKVDPLMRDHPGTEVVFSGFIDFGDGMKAKLVAVELPDLGQREEMAAGIRPATSGIYVVRNGREIMEAQTFGFYQHHHAYTHFRAELTFNGLLDHLFHVDVKKSTIHPDDRLRDKLEAALKKFIVATAQRGRERAEERPIKLSHDTAANRVNAIMAGVTPSAPALAPAEPAAASNGSEEAEAPKKRGRPSKADVEAREAAEKAKQEKAVGPVPAAPTVEYVEVDAGENGRFFSAEKKKDGGLSIQYNARHPFVRMVADAKDKRVSTLLDFVAFALARAEEEHPEGRKLVNRACDYLKLVAGQAA